jgi:hypothetical protein
LYRRHDDMEPYDRGAPLRKRDYYHDRRCVCGMPPSTPSRGPPQQQAHAPCRAHHLPASRWSSKGRNIGTANVAPNKLGRQSLKGHHPWTDAALQACRSNLRECPTPTCDMSPFRLSLAAAP